MKAYISCILLSLLIYSCSSPYQKRTVSAKRDTSWTYLRPDSLEIHAKWKGDTLFRNAIDLRRIRTDGWDYSYPMVSTFDTINCLKVRGRRFSVKDEFIIFSFNRKALKKWCADKTCQKWFEKSGSRIRLDNTRKERLPLYEAVRKIPVEATHISYNEPLGYIVAERYETDSSGGDCYHFMGRRGDTLSGLRIHDRRP